MNGTLWNPAAPRCAARWAAALLAVSLLALPAKATAPTSTDRTSGEATTAPSEAVRADAAPAVRAADAPDLPVASTKAEAVADGASISDLGAVSGADATSGLEAVLDVAAVAEGGTVSGAPAADAVTSETTGPLTGTLPAPREGPEASALVEVPRWAPDGIDPDAEDVGASAGAMLLRTVLVLGVVLAAIYLTLNIGLRRLMGLNAVGARGNGALLQVVERHAVGPRHALLVVRAGSDHLVVGQSDGQMSLISRIEPSQVEAHEAAKAETPPATAVLSPFLKKLLARRGEPGQSPDPAPAPPSTPPSV